jgi:hypothetical protein
MAIQHTVYDTATLLGVFRELEEPTTFWLDLAFGGSALTFEDEYVDFSKINETRKLAPLVVPTSQGVPMYDQAERTFRVKPAYLKPKDPVSAAQMLRRRAGFGELLAAQPLSPQERFDATLAEIARQHRNGIYRHMEKMAADAILYGQVTLEADNYPRTVIDFERDAGHTVTLTVGNRWGESGVSIIDNIEDWLNIIHMAKFGGPVNKIIVGTKAWKAMSANAEIRELLKTDMRQTSGTSLNLGLGNGTQVQRKGNLSQNLEVWVYSDYYEANGAVVPFMDSRDILLIGNNVQGVQCFGAILDKGANFQALPIFPKMWDQEDPSATFLMTQSAPLPVPVNPNNTFRARVVA